MATESEQFVLTEQEYNNFKKIEKIYLNEVDKHNKQSNSKSQISKIIKTIIKTIPSLETGDKIDLTIFQNQKDIDRLYKALLKHNKKLINDQIISIRISEKLPDICETIYHIAYMQKLLHINNDNNQYIGLYLCSKISKNNPDKLFNYFTLRNKNNDFGLYYIPSLKDNIQLIKFKNNNLQIHKIADIIDSSTQKIEIKSNHMISLKRVFHRKEIMND